MFKKLFVFIIISNAYFVTLVDAASRQVWNPTIKNVLLWITENEILPEEDNGLTLLDTIFVWVKDSLTWLLLLAAVWVFLFIWIKIATARWKPDEFKKAISQLTYAIVWIFIVGFAWALVTLVSWLNL